MTELIIRCSGKSITNGKVFETKSSGKIEVVLNTGGRHDIKINSLDTGRAMPYRAWRECKIKRSK